MTKITAPDIDGSYDTAMKSNEYLRELEEQLTQKVLYRDNSGFHKNEPNFMLNDTDMDGNSLIVPSYDLNVGGLATAFIESITEFDNRVTSLEDLLGE